MQSLIAWQASAVGFPTTFIGESLDTGRLDWTLFSYDSYSWADFNHGEFKHY